MQWLAFLSRVRKVPFSNTGKDLVYPGKGFLSSLSHSGHILW